MGTFADLRAAAAPMPIEIGIGMGDDVFRLQLKRLDRTQLERLFKASSKKTLGPDGRTYVEQLQPAALRKRLVDDGVIQGWEGLTGAMALRLAGLTPNEDDPAAEKPLEFTTANALDVLEAVPGMEAAILEEITQLVRRRDADEATEKKT